MITDATRQSVFERANGRCENPKCLKNIYYNSQSWDCHHIYWKSQYNKEDRDEAWNLSCACAEPCHYSIHSQGNTTLDKYLKALADKRKPKEERSKKITKDIIRQRVFRKKIYSDKIQKFKDSHGGLSPTQIEYRKKKEFLKNIKRNIDIN